VAEFQLVSLQPFLWCTYQPSLAAFSWTCQAQRCYNCLAGPPRLCTVVPWPVHLHCRLFKSLRTSLFLQRLPRSTSSSLFHCWQPSIFGCWSSDVELPATGGHVGTVSVDLPHSTRDVSPPPKMTYIVSGGALNSTHSLTHSRRFCSLNDFLTFSAFIWHLLYASALKYIGSVNHRFCLQWHTCLFCVEYSLRLSEVCAIFWNCGLTAMKSTPFLLYVYWTFCRRFGHILWWNFCVSVRFATHILHCCLIELV